MKTIRLDFDKNVESRIFGTGMEPGRCIERRSHCRLQIHQTVECAE